MYPREYKNLDIYFKIWEMYNHVSSLKVIWLLALLDKHDNNKPLY